MSLLLALVLTQSMPLQTSATGGVSLTTSQTITGAKTFTATLSVSDTIQFPDGKIITNGSSQIAIYGGALQQILIGSGNTYFNNASHFRGDIDNDSGNSVNLADVVSFAPQAAVVADNANGATAAANTLLPTKSAVTFTCNDANGCDITMSETNAVDGAFVTIVNASTNVCNFADTSGVSELAGTFAMGQWDSLTLKYVTDRWVEVARSNN